MEDVKLPPPKEWDLDSDEIASVTSEDLNDNRPNRWTGSTSTWRRLTREERMLWDSMQRLESQDLAMHLYNVFQLRQRARNEVKAGDQTVNMEDEQAIPWAPPKSWTAWPARENRVPSDGLFQEEKDGYEAFTLRMEEKKMPSMELESELTATVLRLAKERYRRRSTHRHPTQPSIEAPSSPLPKTRDSDSEMPGSPVPSSPPLVAKAESGDDSDHEILHKLNLKEYLTSSPSPSSPNKEKDKNRAYEATVSTDDDLSRALLRPSIRHILSKLDDTLTILHNSRVAGISHLSDSDSSTEEESDAATRSPRGRGRPRLLPPAGAGSFPIQQPSLQGPRRRGRPRKIHTPREGETQEEMQIRVARESHRRIPMSVEAQEAAFESWVERGDAQIKALSEHQQQHADEINSPTDFKQPQQETNGDTSGEGSDPEIKLRKLGIRDWSDVLGAASLAGFPSEVIARASRRCADLFNEGIVINHLDEGPASRGPGFSSTEYRPRPIHLDPADDSAPSSDIEAAALQTLSQRRIASRQASLARSRSSAASTSPGPQDRGRQDSLSRSRSRSRSRSSAGLLFCPIASCDRAATGFSRRANLTRHMRLVHPGHASEEDDSDDEMVGAVHVDGFLKTIHPSRGWRGEDMLARKRKRPNRGRKSPGAGSDDSS